ncbi:hypothetical protein JAAARDRAFT_55087 [Jaapia argillacea MUCL 33604]|uniref:JmjC domain-containing protein n=1 Tax=Jaapia argillacea MUCL 33604 TaxID=933084 RepID=A0A067Q6F0_9AGAM|nr:hypothetical protein JAAARDRAFT_55087 [Jaapia argillacea MUCL 33604]
MGENLKVLKVFQAQGNVNRPSSLMEVERVIWTIVIGVARGYDCLQQLSLFFKWWDTVACEKIARCDAADRTWLYHLQDTARTGATIQEFRDVIPQPVRNVLPQEEEEEEEDIEMIESLERMRYDAMRQSMEVAIKAELKEEIASAVQEEVRKLLQDEEILHHEVSNLDVLAAKHHTTSADTERLDITRIEVDIPVIPTNHSGSTPSCSQTTMDIPHIEVLRNDGEDKIRDQSDPVNSSMDDLDDNTPTPSPPVPEVRSSSNSWAQSAKHKTAKLKRQLDVTKHSTRPRKRTKSSKDNLSSRKSLTPLSPEPEERDVPRSDHDEEGAGDSSSFESRDKGDKMEIDKESDNERSVDVVKVVAPLSSVASTGEKTVEFYTFRTLKHIAEHEYALAQQISSSVQSRFINGIPLHFMPLARNRSLDESQLDSTSTIYVVDYVDFLRLETADLHHIFASRHILVRGHPIMDEYSWSPASLSRLGGWDKPVVMQDLSRRELDDPLKQQTMDTLSTLYNESNKGGKGRLLNALDFPIGGMAVSRITRFHDLATHQSVWQHTADKKELISDHDISWGMASCQDSTSWVHVNADGLATAVQVLTGSKIWAVARPKRGTQTFNFDDSSAKWLSSQFDSHGSCIDVWDYEAVKITPSDLLFMRPNTPHWVLTTSPCILAGRHFYSAACVESSCWSLVHNFFLGKLITNIAHPHLWTLLRRMMIFWVDLLNSDNYEGHPQAAHVPDPSHVRGLYDYLAVGCIIVFASTLDPRSYSKARLSCEALHDVEHAKTSFLKFMQYFTKRYRLEVYGDYEVFREALIHFATVIHWYALTESQTETSTFHIQYQAVTLRLSQDIRLFWNDDAADEFERRASEITSPMTDNDMGHGRSSLRLQSPPLRYVETYSPLHVPEDLHICFRSVANSH